jgi:hypothetical protein
VSRCRLREPTKTSRVAFWVRWEWRLRRRRRRFGQQLPTKSISKYPIARRKTKSPAEFLLRGSFRILAERVGFEPTVRGNRTPDFESGTFDHSATSPGYCIFTTSPALVGDRRSEDYRRFFEFYKPSFSFEQTSRSGKFVFPERRRGAVQDAASRRATPPM